MYCPEGNCPGIYGLCHCGCGRKANIIKYRDQKYPIRVPGKPFKYLRGHRSQTISDADVAVIRRRYLDGGVTQQALADEYHVSARTIRQYLYFASRSGAGVA